MTTKENSTHSVADNKLEKQQSADDSSTAIIMGHQAYAATTAPIDINSSVTETTEHQTATESGDPESPAAGVMEHQAYAATTNTITTKPFAANSNTHLYAPYMIAISFIAMTGLLTLLLTTVMDNKAELDHVTSKQGSEPILADARIAFGQESVTPVSKAEQQAALPALLPEEAAVSPADIDPSTTNDNQVTTVSTNIDKKAQPKNAINKLMTPPASTGNTADSEVATLIHGTDEAEIKSSENTSNSDQVNPAAAELTAQPTKPEHGGDTSTPEVAVTQLPTGEKSESIDQVINAHDQQIKQIRTAILEQSYESRQQVEQVITSQMNMMEKQVRQFEENLRPGYPPAIAAYERMINRRRASFQRMMQNREKLLQRVHRQHERLLERYSQLLKLLDQEIAGIS